MNNLLFGAITPHGLPEIPTIAGKERESFSKIRTAMEDLAEKIISKDVDTIIIMTPHGLRIDGHTSIYTCNYTSGELSYNSEDFGYDNPDSDLGDETSSENKKSQVEYLRFECDRELARNIYDESLKQGLHVVSCNYGVTQGPLSDIKMDWGVFVPMWFLRTLQDRVKLVVINPGRDISSEELKRFGKIIKTQIEKSGKKVGIIASADQGHAHMKDGPYGYDPASKKFDDHIVEIVKNDELEKLMDISGPFFEDAKADSLWQMLVLHGAIEGTDLRGEFYEYDVPSYFGMLVAGYF